MKYINLNKGQVAIVDDEDFEELNKYKWHVTKHRNAFYARRANYGKRPHQVYMHRQILKGVKIVDHINRNSLDNRRCNLRSVNHSQSSMNRKIKNKSGFRGVRVHNNRWDARISIYGESIVFGSFDKKEDAIKAYIDGINKLGLNEFIPL